MASVWRDGTRSWQLLGAVTLIGCGLVVGFHRVAGTYDNESFQCGSPFAYDNSEGYGGTDEFEDCNRTRKIGLPLALGSLALGIAVGAPALVQPRRSA